MAERERLTGDELEAQDGAALPEKEAMSTISLDLGGIDIDNFAMPINEATAINSQTVNSYAIADADQIVYLPQSVDGDAD